MIQILAPRSRFVNNPQLHTVVPPSGLHMNFLYTVRLRVTRAGNKATKQLLICDVNRISVKSNCVHLPQHGPGVDSVSNRNEYQGYFLRHKGYVCVGLTTLPPSLTVQIFWELQHPEARKICRGP